VAYLPVGRQVFGKRNEKSPQSREAGYFAQKIGIKISWDFVPPYDFTAHFLASRAIRCGEQTSASSHKKSRSPIWCPLFENARTFFERN